MTDHRAGEDKVGVQEPEHLTVPDSKTVLKDGDMSKGQKATRLKEENASPYRYTYRNKLKFLWGVDISIAWKKLPTKYLCNYQGEKRSSTVEKHGCYQGAPHHARADWNGVTWQDAMRRTGTFLPKIYHLRLKGAPPDKSKFSKLTGLSSSESPRSWESRKN